MQKPFRDRIISEFIGDLDRGSNKLASHFHEVANYLTGFTFEQRGQHSRTTTRSEWLAVICGALSLCNFCTSSGNPLREHVYRTNVPHSVPGSAFLVASMTGHTDVEASILQAGLSPRNDCIFLGHPFQMACRLGHAATVERLLQAGVMDSTTQHNDVDLSALYTAVSYNHLEIVQLLVPKYSFEAIKTAARRAVQGGSRDVSAFIIEQYPLAGCDSFGMIAQNGWDDILQKMLDADFYSQIVAERGLSLLRDAAEGGHLSTCQMLTSFGLAQDIIKVYSPRKVAFAAASGGNVDVLKFLIQHGLRVRNPIAKGCMFIIAAMKGHVAFLEHCINRKYHMKHMDAPGLHVYALFAAIAHKQGGTVEMLLSLLSLDPDTTIIHDDGTETTPLRVAVDGGSGEMVHFLVKLGASPHKREYEIVGLGEQDRRKRANLIVDEWRCKLKLQTRHAMWSYNATRRQVENAHRVLLEARTDSV